MYKIIECIFGFETGDDATIKTLKVLAGILQVVFIFMFFAYCMYPVWIDWSSK